ncbi:MAG: BrnT family toxin [Desulfuromonadaceae bacterium]|nr:BrnT family toxin [Desulfuromonadaceae bacterium]
MKITYNEVKNSRNIEERGLSFELFASIDWDNSVVREDTRKDYGERRFRVFGYIGERLHVAVITPRNGGIHVISLRKANNREVKEHGNNQTESMLD